MNNVPLKRNTSSRSNLKNILIGIIFATTVMLAQFAFGSNGVWLYAISTKVIGLKWALGVTCLYGLRILAMTALIWAMGMFVARRQTVADAMRVWLTTLWASFFLLAALLVVNSQMWYTSLYNTFFLITRNAFPMVTGLIAFIPT